MRRVVKGLLVLCAAAVVSAPIQARADGFVIPWIGATFSQGPTGANEFFSDTKNGKVAFGAALGATGGGGIFGFDVDFGYTPNFFTDVSGISNNVFTLMADLTAGPSITAHGGQGVRPYATFGIGLVHPKFADQSSENDFGYNVGGGIIGYFTGHLGIRGDIRFTQTVNNSDFANTIRLSSGKFHFWRASAGIVIQ